MEIEETITTYIINPEGTKVIGWIGKCKAKDLRKEK